MLKLLNGSHMNLTDKHRITKSGFQNLIKSREESDLERAEVVKIKQKAAEYKDFRENAEYHEATATVSQLDEKILKLDGLIATAIVIEKCEIKDYVDFWATITIINLDSNIISKYTIVGDYEADISNCLISELSPLAKLFLGCLKGDIVEHKTDKFLRTYKIENIQYLNFNE
jgi:transcription elongation factor GreA